MVHNTQKWGYTTVVETKYRAGGSFSKACNGLTVLCSTIDMWQMRYFWFIWLCTLLARNPSSAIDKEIVQIEKDARVYEITKFFQWIIVKIKMQHEYDVRWNYGYYP